MGKTKVLKEEAETSQEEPGVVYIGHIPHGFYEQEMRQYFSQFGPINKLRVSRNKKTGAAKHYAFIEFAEASTAETVAKSMDNYMLFGHNLRVKVVPPSQVHERLWEGANRRFKKVAWNKIAGKQLERPASESTWTNRVSKEEKRRQARAKKLEEIGYELEAPKLKAAKATEVPALEASKETAA
ncbi:putative ribosomal biogenesis protein gar2 protein [Phaeoacremonium minimum UCRPA7]|uniref:Putative ribosomal biogenesis protein gar2 protein n=1 Tax=Phaeoacremonium minimum (strain UCR-PA7) TaxID=1286976 RepID=R8BMM3_PHAM7|nr:putative ribosomal biogenesis protein gar2 protein [Phaeoacremonium minimum UCRPA7]EOO00648.1 putative ribosomal biogenesis protein gar2 protein [Phaeoacremonium minimum UCRPA7]